MNEEIEAETLEQATLVKQVLYTSLETLCTYICTLTVIGKVSLAQW